MAPASTAVHESCGGKTLYAEARRVLRALRLRQCPPRHRSLTLSFAGASRLTMSIAFRKPSMYPSRS